MSKPFYLSRKFWTAIVTAVSMVAAHFTGNDDIAKLIVGVGSTLILGLGLEDFGKSSA